MSNVSTAKYKNGIRLDNPYVSTPRINPLKAEKPPGVYRAKFIKLPHGHFEIMVTQPDPDSIDAMGRPVRLCDMVAKDRTEEEQAERNEANKKRACRLARQRVRLLSKCIGADHMITLTYREVVQDIEKLKKDFENFVRAVHIKHPEWVYVATFEKQRADSEDWSYHMHLAVHGKQDIKYLLRCWLRAIGQAHEEINDWLIRGDKLGEKSKGAVNVTKPNKRFTAASNTSATWQANKLAAYMTKYISKEFDTVQKGAKKYWHSRGIEKPEVIKFWLGATNFPDAIKEAYEKLFYSGVTSYDQMHSCEEFGIVWLTASTSRDRIGKTSSQFCDLSED